MPDDGWVEDPAAADVWGRGVGEGGVEKNRRNNFLAGEGGVAVCEGAFPALGMLSSDGGFSSTVDGLETMVWMLRCCGGGGGATESSSASCLVYTIRAFAGKASSAFLTLSSLAL